MAEQIALTEATLEPRGPAGAFLLTDEQVAILGGGKRTFPVRVTIAGRTLGLRVARMGGENMIGMSKAARAGAGVEIGSTYDVMVVLDDGERAVEVPADLAAALAADTDVQAAFATLPPSHRKEHVRWVEEAKQDETRARRVAETVDRVRASLTR